MSLLSDHRVHLAGPHIVAVLGSVDQDPGEHSVVGSGGIKREANLRSRSAVYASFVRETRSGMSPCLRAKG